MDPLISPSMVDDAETIPFQRERMTVGFPVHAILYLWVTLKPVTVCVSCVSYRCNAILLTRVESLEP